jgi:glutathione reductase (NADPH)
MASYDYDLFVIGAGSGGVRAARLTSGRYGKRVAVAEEYRIGGTCVIRGCVPKKLLVFASEFPTAFAHAEGFGWSFPEAPRHDWPKLITAVSAEVDRLSGIYRRNLENAGVEVIDERAELVDPHTIELKKSGRKVTAATVLVSTGARPHWPKDLQGVELAFSSNEVFQLKELPKHVVIAGGGYIACEFAAVFAGLGADVCLIYRGDTVLRGFDMDVRTDVHEGLARAGVRVITHAEIEAIEERPGGRRATRLNTGVTVESDAVLLALGRQPNTEGMGLEAAGVETTGRGAVKVDAYSRTSAPHIYAVGDVTDRLQLTPVAIREAEAFVKTAFAGQPTAFDHSAIPTAVFTTPEVGVVGCTEGDARRTFGDIEVYKTRFRPMSHVLAGDPERMLMKLLVRKSDQVVVGCHIVGPGAGELIQLAGIAVRAGLTKQAWDDTCAVHPTVAEELVTLREPWRDPSLPPG